MTGLQYSIIVRYCMDYGTVWIMVPDGLWYHTTRYRVVPYGTTVMHRSTVFRTSSHNLVLVLLGSGFRN